MDVTQVNYQRGGYDFDAIRCSSVYNGADTGVIPYSMKVGFFIRF